MRHLIEKLVKRWEKLKDEKSQWHAHWDDLARVMLPRRLGFSTTTTDGERRTDGVYDSTPMQAARGLANAVGGLLRPDGLQVVKIKANSEDINQMEEALVWLEDSRNRLKSAFNNPKARFRQASGEVDQDLVVFGTAVMYAGESSQKNHLLFQSCHLKDITVIFGEEGSPIGLFRKRKMPIHQLVSRFGEKNLSEQLRRQMEQDKDVDKKIDVLHAVVSRETRKKNPLLAKDMPWADYWIEIEAKHKLSEGGFHELPFIVPRWDTSSGEDYGRSPGMIALPDADTLQAMGETILIAGQRAADPPLAVPNDGFFDAINTFPGGLAYYDVETAAQLKGSPFFPIVSGMNLPIGRDMQADTRNQVWAAFFRNILNLPVEGPEMTATEVIRRKEEFMREIGPVFGRLESDYTGPVVERAFMILLRAGAFAPIPLILQGQDIRFEYDSPVIHIGKQIEAAATRLWVQEQIMFANDAQKPDILDNIDFDEYARISALAVGVPRKIIKPVEIVDQIRQSRNEAMAAQEEKMAAQETLMAAKMGAEIAEKASKADQTQQQTEA